MGKNSIELPCQFVNQGGHPDGDKVKQGVVSLGSSSRDKSCRQSLVAFRKLEAVEG